jgi:hypothetical protein
MVLSEAEMQIGEVGQDHGHNLKGEARVSKWLWAMGYGLWLWANADHALSLAHSLLATLTSMQFPA